jgi:DNA polymerase (family 10)
MINQELAKIFYEIADLLEADRVAFKPQAWRKAAMSLEAVEENVADVYKTGGIKGLENIPGVGTSIAEKIEEFIKTGRIAYYEELKRGLPMDLEEIIAVEGVGPKRAKVLYQKLAIKTLNDLEAAAKSHKIAGLAGFGETSETNILQGIDFVRRSQGRFLLGTILPRAREIQKMVGQFAGVKRIEIAGSLRRRKETIGDVDLLAILAARSGPAVAKRVMDDFVAQPGVEKVWGKGATKASVRLDDGFDVDLRILPQRSYGAAMQYFTGSKEHNVALRRIAIEKGLKLSEYGLFRGPKMLPSATEEEIYEQLGLEWIPPEIRENEGEIQAARAKKLPKLIEYGSLKGDLHCHSDWDGGHNSIEEIAQAAMARGYEYVGIADHTKLLSIEKGLDEKELRKRNIQIDKLNKKYKNFKILKGCEANIKNDGSIDIDDQALSELDFVIAGVHSNHKLDKEAQTARVLKAMANPNVDIISHPTGRLLKKRESIEIDLEKMFAAAAKTGTILEINSQPMRLDLNDHNIRRAKDYGVKMVIDTDVHVIEHMHFAEYGIAQARRGWTENSDIINVHPLEKLMSYFKKN